MDNFFCGEFIQQSVYRINENTNRVIKCLQEIDESEIWQRPNENSNSLGNIILHLCGNIRQYIISSLNETEDIRVRDKEFSIKEGLSKKELIAKLENVVDEAIDIIEKADDKRLTKIYSVQGFNLSGIGIIVHVTEHYSYHTGQIAFWVKLLKNKDLGFYASIDLNVKKQQLTFHTMSLLQPAHMEMYDNENTVQKSFDIDFLTEYLVQAQWAEFIELKKIITELYAAKGNPISILDIGIGNARIPKHLSGIKEIWDMIERYDGTDNAQTCVDISKKVVAELGIQDKVNAFFYDASQLDKWDKKYDLIITTWFTAGNFYPENFPFDTYMEAGETMDLSKNEKFGRIFTLAYNLLKPGGEVVIGSCYIDNDRTRKKQEEFYRKAGMTIITKEKDSFTATKERFWSQRFTQKKLLDYLSFVMPEKISFTALDTYEYAMQVRIRK